MPAALKHHTTTKRRLRIAAAVIVVAIGWYLFRPELLFISHSVNETFPTTATQPTTPAHLTPRLLSQGRFHGVAHATQGLATIYQLPDGKRALRLTEFETSNGPDVQVYLVATNDATDNETVTKAGFIHLGALKGNVGDQNYEVPAEVDLSTYQSVTIWCRRFGVNFGTAPLNQQHS
jgi:Electron transfer DM13